MGGSDYNIGHVLETKLSRLKCLFSLLGVLAMERVCIVVVFVILAWFFNIQGQEQQGKRDICHLFLSFNGRFSTLSDKL